MLHEVAIIEVTNGKPTGRFEITNVIASDAEAAKAKAIAASKLAQESSESVETEIKLKVRTF